MGWVGKSLGGPSPLKDEVPRGLLFPLSMGLKRKMNCERHPLRPTANHLRVIQYQLDKEKGIHCLTSLLPSALAQRQQDRH